MSIKLPIILLSLIAISGCSTNQKNVTDYKLCYSLATKPSYNIHTEARTAEVRSRGIDCRAYADRIDQEERAIKLEKAGRTTINNNTTIRRERPKIVNPAMMCSYVAGTVVCL